MDYHPSRHRRAQDESQVTRSMESVPVQEALPKAWSRLDQLGIRRHG